ncbi:MAG: Gfo/Idh/MocA family oxidoreductase, partial [Microbacterium sp.]|nr:Gfo/Idh/MocA family oxidoreductase [Microbacterium sp.]
RQGRSPQSGWYSDAPLSGGVLLDLMIHDIDVARWVAGDVARVFARTNAVGASQTTQAFLTHASGAISQLTATWTTAPIEFRTLFDVAGSTGLLSADSDVRRPFAAVTTSVDGDTLLPRFDALTSPYRAELADFLAGIDEGRPPRVTARDGLEAMRIADAIARSAETGRVIALTDDTQEVAA